MNKSNYLTEEKYQRWYNLVYAYFYRRISTKQDADDLTSQTLSIFFLYEKPIDEPKKFIWGIARNQLKNFFYQKTKTPFSAYNIEEMEEILDSNYSVEYQKRGEEIIECAKKQLNETDFNVVELCVLCDFNSQKAAEELQLTPANVRQKLSRSLKKLRQTCRALWKNLNS